MGVKSVGVGVKTFTQSVGIGVRVAMHFTHF